jgi:hypothetical protein
LKTQGCHWNVAGPRFYDRRKLFEEQHGALAAANDEAKAPASDARVQSARRHRGKRRRRLPTMLRQLFTDNRRAGAPRPPASAFLALLWCPGALAAIHFLCGGP